MDLRGAVPEHGKAHTILSSSTLRVQVKILSMTLVTFSTVKSSPLVCKFQKKKAARGEGLQTEHEKERQDILRQ